MNAILLFNRRAKPSSKGQLTIPLESACRAERTIKPAAISLTNSKTDFRSLTVPISHAISVKRRIAYSSLRSVETFPNHSLSTLITRVRGSGILQIMICLKHPAINKDKKAKKAEKALLAYSKVNIEYDTNEGASIVCFLRDTLPLDVAVLDNNRSLKISYL